MLFSMPSIAGDEKLDFRLDNALHSRVSLTELEKNLKSHRIRLFNPIMDKEKTYAAFALRDVLDFTYQDQWRSGKYPYLAFIAIDAYEAISETSLLQQEGGYLAYRDLDMQEGWEPIGYKQADPAPFFIVWTGKDQTPRNAYPWPWQLAGMDLSSFEDRYPAVVPKGASEDSAAWRGFVIFRARCLRCHAMDQQGGKVGPDLNAPQSIAAYRSRQMIKSFIRDPTLYRYTLMPDHTDLSESDLDDLYEYFRFQMERKTQTRQPSN